MDGDQVSDARLVQSIRYVLKRNRNLLGKLNAKRDRDELERVAERVVAHFRLCGYRVYGRSPQFHSSSDVMGPPENGD